MTFLSWLTASRFGRSPQAPPSPASPVAPAAPVPPLPPMPPGSPVPSKLAQPGAGAHCAYPPVDPGITASATGRILEANQDLIDRTKLAYGADKASFERDIVSLLRRYADYVNLLPATADNYFRDPGGLFRMGLETAFYALQATDAQIFEGRATITSRRHLEPRWRLATFIAGLCAALYRSLNQLTVRDEAGTEWPAYLVPLTLWLEERRSQRFFLSWNAHAQDMRSAGLFALPMIVDRSVLHYLAADNNVVVPHMLASITGMPNYREHNVLDELVRRSTAMIIDRDLQASADRFGKPALGAHLERYLVDALRRLVANSAAWQPNSERARLWLGKDGLFMVWPGALHDVAALLESEHLPGIPKLPQTMLDVLLDAGVVRPQSSSRATWTIYPPPGQAPLEALRLAVPAVILGGTDPAALPVTLTARPPKGGAPGPANPAPQQYQLHLVAGAHGPVDGSGKLVGDTLRERPQHKSLRADLDEHQMTERQAAEDAALEISLASMPRDGDPDPPVAPPADPSLEQRPLRSAPIELRAPLSLNPMVATPLAEIVAQLGRRGQHACRTVASGIFVPLVELERRKVDTSIALRTLDSAGMLVRVAGDEGVLQEVDFDGAPTIGVVLSPRYVSGLNPDDFVAGGDGSDAGA